MSTPDPLRTYTKDPGAVLDYGFDWSEWLSSGDTISASSWSVNVASLTIGDNSFSDDATAVWLSAGTDGLDYLLTNRITTTDGRTEDRTMLILIRQR